LSSFDRFEDIEAWKESKALAADVYKLTNQGVFKRDFGLRDQVRRSAVSVMANIAEGFGRKTNKDFANFLYTSRASAMEVISHLYIAMELDYLNNDQFEPLRRGYEAVIGKTTRLISYLESSSGAQRNPKRRTKNKEPRTK